VRYSKLSLLGGCRSIAINYTRIRDVEKELRVLQMQVRAVPVSDQSPLCIHIGTQDYFAPSPVMSMPS